VSAALTQRLLWSIFGAAQSVYRGVLTRAPAFIEHRFKLMGGPARLFFEPPLHYLNDPQIIVRHVLEMLIGLENQYSRYVDNSLVSQINKRSGTGIYTPIDAEARGLLDFCDQLHRESGGLFDPTAGVLNKVWDFRRSKATNPVNIESLLPLVGWDKVRIDERGISLTQPNSQLDLGGIVKEYAADKVAHVLREMGVARGMVELAGDIATVGAKTDQQAWQIGISGLHSPQTAVLSVDLTNACLATSGTSQRFVEIDGQRYSHFLNPTTGQPVRGSFSVSVVADSCLIAGSIATVACLVGADQAIPWLESSGLPWLMIDNENLRGPIANQYAYQQSKVAPQQSVPNPQ
jgi:thiamine biosynthesis lipoprotein